MDRSHHVLDLAARRVTCARARRITDFWYHRHALVPRRIHEFYCAWRRWYDRDYWMAVYKCTDGRRAFRFIH
jgi:hypothetical protein